MCQTGMIERVGNIHTIEWQKVALNFGVLRIA